MVRRPRTRESTGRRRKKCMCMGRERGKKIERERGREIEREGEEERE